ncbi:MAG: hypothetical protein ACRDHZ_10335 [Ktedonobacteraceae bacterium]
MRVFSTFLALALSTSPVFAQTQGDVGFKGLIPGSTLSQCVDAAARIGATLKRRDFNTKRDPKGNVITFDYMFDPMMTGLTLAESKVDQGSATFVPSSPEPRLSKLSVVISYDEYDKVRDALENRYGKPTFVYGGLVVWEKGNASVSYSKQFDDSLEHSIVMFGDMNLSGQEKKKETAKAASDL